MSEAVAIATYHSSPYQKLWPYIAAYRSCPYQKLCLDHSIVSISCQRVDSILEHFTDADPANWPKRAAAVKAWSDLQQHLRSILRCCADVAVQRSQMTLERQHQYRTSGSLPVVVTGSRLRGVAVIIKMCHPEAGSLYCKRVRDYMHCSQMTFERQNVGFTGVALKRKVCSWIQLWVLFTVITVLRVTCIGNLVNLLDVPCSPLERFTKLVLSHWCNTNGNK